MLRQARFCAWPPLVLSLRPYAYRRCLPLRTLTSLCRSASLLRTSTSGIALSTGRSFGNGFLYGRGQYFLLLVCLLIILSFSSHASCPEVFSRTMLTNMFLEVASVVCYGVQVAVTSFSSSLAGQVTVAILFEILRCSCLLGFSVQLSFGVATSRICIRPRRPLV